MDDACSRCGGSQVRVWVEGGAWSCAPCECVDIECPACDGLGWIERWEGDGERPRVWRFSDRCRVCGLPEDKARALEWARFPAKYVRACMEPPPSAPVLHHWLREWLVRWQPGGPGLFVHGAAGTGKTHAVVAGLRKLVEMRQVHGRPVRVRYVDLPQLCQELKERMYESDARLELMRPLRSASVLAIDEVGGGRRTGFDVLDVLSTLVQDRYNAGRTTIFVSNYSLDELLELLHVDHAHTSARRLVDRMREMTTDSAGRGVLTVPANTPNRRRQPQTVTAAGGRR